MTDLPTLQDVAYWAIMDIKDSTALITGANGGLGEAIATALSQAGARLVLTGRRADALQPIADKLGAKMIIADLSNREEVARIAREAGAIDLLVANAALPATGYFPGLEESFIDRTLDVNLRVPIVMAREFVGPMLERKRGHLVFISSIAGKVAAVGSSMYSASKFGMRGFALSLREDLRGSGVSVSTIFPGFIRDAGMFAKTKVKLPGPVGTKTPQDVAAAVLRAVRHDVAEIDVAAADQKFGAFLAALSPTLLAAITRTFGGTEVARQIVATQKDVR